MKPFTKETQVGLMDVEQFTAMMVSIQETKGYIQAQREQELTQRIFKDSEGIIAGGAVPFRVNNIEDAKKLYQELSQYFAEKGAGSFVVSYALLVDGGYKKP